jgi:hypothetical protein
LKALGLSYWISFLLFKSHIETCMCHNPRIIEIKTTATAKDMVLNKSAHIFKTSTIEILNNQFKAYSSSS